MAIGQKIYELREQRGYSDQQLADALSLAITKYRSLELDANEWTVQQLIQAADFLHVSIDELLGRSAAEPESASPDLKTLLQQGASFEGRSLTAEESKAAMDLLHQFSLQWQRLRDLTELIRSDANLVKKLQELKIVSSKLDSEAIVKTLDKSLIGTYSI
ncbi:helix-turn-helix domain-containing protein [Paenibacillus oenotherae]|uniref:Helix-turn-helix domain-containing protein n=1 Tax=Paenibacillus oenotherae TaxID=1435645 RepID=A0ABS7DAT6_9BACL|nr:helix-turn-helix transcriptional regulator [Paenibacillus oenotherae]MBW7477001.1 helix-turn-helix domain-containing protein [Paenibacillus oenotherae]